MPSFRNTVLSAAAFAGAAMAETHVVKVGQDGLAFDPMMTTAAVGDVVEFHFWPANHSVVAGDMESGCTPLADGGFYSGFMPVDSGMGDMVFQVDITSTDAWVFYCSQGKHCQNGMYGMINGDEDMASAYGELAAAATSNESPAEAEAFGGTVTEASSNGTTTEEGDAETTEGTDEGGAGMTAASMGATFAAFAVAIFMS